MIDPKSNRIHTDEDETSELQSARREAAKPRSGLSVNDTIARDANLSVGGQGVNVSGVSAGAGAGAGSTHLTPTTSSSPAPNVVPGGRGTGVTPLGETQAAKSIGSRMDLGENRIIDEEISRRAYTYWCQRGCPLGSPEVDWHRAERELREERLRKASAASA
ncbi:MAG: DUF2934 domain-containing protein [Bryobacterales bacterium]|nr:DUF2934 domain-containing protein [Bryobacterales bacterium]